MKRLIAGFLLWCVAGSAAAAYSATADAKASCNASFHEGCKTDQTFTASSSGFAAPAGVLGGSPVEGALLSLLVAAGVAGRFYRSVAKGSRVRGLRGALKRWKASRSPRNPRTGE